MYSRFLGFFVCFGVDLWIMNAPEVFYVHILRSAAMKLECINGYLDKLLHLGIEESIRIRDLGHFGNKGFIQ